MHVPTHGAVTMALAILVVIVGSVSSGAQTTGTLTGVVQDARTRQPLPGVVVEIRQPPQSVTTDAEGRFRLEAVPSGAAQLNLSLVGYAFTKRDVQVGAGETAVTILLSEGTTAVDETVTVQGDLFGVREAGVAGQQSIGSAELRQLGGMTLDDPLRAVQALAGVNASDDFYSELAVRGNGFRQLNYTLDGVPAQLLMHTIEGIEDGGSVAMLNIDVLDHVSLLRGSYPQRYGARLGAGLEFASREGSRQGRRFNLTASGTSASFTAEGPLGETARGSWLVSARRSYLDAFLRQVLDDSSVAFGFTDLFSKVVYDLSDAHQVQATVVLGRSQLDGDEDDGPEALADATRTGWMASGAWRHTVSPTFVLNHRAFALGESFDNDNRQGDRVVEGNARDVGYRLDMSHGAGAGRLIEAGFSVQRLSERRLQAFRVPGWRILGGEDFDEGATNVGAYGQLRATAGAFTFTPGVRVDRSGLTEDTVGSPWLQIDWKVPANMTVVLGAGLHHQFPDVAQVLGRRGQAALEPERAVHVDAGLEGRWRADTRWQVTVYNREERDVIDLPGLYFQNVDGQLRAPSATSLWENRLEGTSRGIEFMLQRKSPDKLSGWVAYSLGKTEYTDQVTGETFDGDFDQRHTLAAFARYRFSDRMSANVRWRYGSNRPIVGYVDRRSPGEFFVGAIRNATRVPDYSRLDVRADRTFRWGNRRLTLFGEIINILNRDNVRQRPPFVNDQTGQIFEPVESIFPIVPSIGATLEF